MSLLACLGHALGLLGLFIFVVVIAAAVLLLQL